VVFLSLPPSRSLLHPSTLSFIPSFTYLLVVSPVLTTPQVRASEEDEKEGDVVEDGEGINESNEREERVETREEASVVLIRYLK
jgi:hypothetical protein